VRALAVAAFSARVLAEMAALEGYDVVALDLFGDRDTQRAASRWIGVGEPATLRVDGDRLLAALDGLRADGLQGWIAGSGFDGRAELLAESALRLPLIGNAAATVAQVRDPQAFFAALDDAGIAYPPVTREWPADARGWLVKDAAGSGGAHIRAAERVSLRSLSASAYLQRERPGLPMSATFIANGRDAVVLGCNEQIVRRFGDWPFLYCGIVGPVPLPDAAREEAGRIVQVLTARFRLRGLGSLDFLLDGERLEVLELNPRPPASLALYPHVGAGGPIEAHLQACTAGELPAVGRRPATVRGSEIVFARGPLRLEDRHAAWLAQQPDAHDLPRAGYTFSAGEPVCSVGAEGASPLAVREQLAQRRDALLTSLETLA
jgi:predicted ATP-grasp superfamily ATP-dependent carboligase